MSDDCALRALPDEPTFTLLARDRQAPDLVRAWAAKREERIWLGHAPESDRERVVEAHRLAAAMEAWRLANAETAPWRAPMPLFEQNEPPRYKGVAILQAADTPVGETPCQRGEKCDDGTCRCS